MRGAILPGKLLAELIGRGATIRHIAPAGSLSTSPNYRPSTATAEFVRSRDLTCRMPGCTRPAYHADIDHTRPYPHGLTHPSELKCYCRLHHPIKVRREALVFRMGVRDPDP